MEGNPSYQELLGILGEIPRVTIKDRGEVNMISLAENRRTVGNVRLRGRRGASGAG